MMRKTAITISQVEECFVAHLRRYIASLVDISVSTGATPPKKSFTDGHKQDFPTDELGSRTSII